MQTENITAIDLKDSAILAKEAVKILLEKKGGNVSLFDVRE